MRLQQVTGVFNLEGIAGLGHEKCFRHLVSDLEVRLTVGLQNWWTCNGKVTPIAGSAFQFRRRQLLLPHRSRFYVSVSGSEVKVASRVC